MRKPPDRNSFVVSFEKSTSPYFSYLGKANGVPLTDMTDSFCRACLLGYVGVLGGKTGLKVVDAGLNWEEEWRVDVRLFELPCLTGEVGRDLEGETSLMGVGIRFEPASRFDLVGMFVLRVGVFWTKALALFAFGVALVGEGGATRGVLDALSSS